MKPRELRGVQTEELREHAVGVLAEQRRAALYGAPPSASGFMLNLRLVARSNLERLYRSDATYYERLHWQAMIDTSPEDLAARARKRFGGDHNT